MAAAGNTRPPGAGPGTPARRCEPPQPPAALTSHGRPVFNPHPRTAGKWCRMPHTPRSPLPLHLPTAGPLAYRWPPSASSWIVLLPPDDGARQWAVGNGQWAMGNGHSRRGRALKAPLPARGATRACTAKDATTLNVPARHRRRGPPHPEPTPLAQEVSAVGTPAVRVPANPSAVFQGTGRDADASTWLGPGVHTASAAHRGTRIEWRHRHGGGHRPVACCYFSFRRRSKSCNRFLTSRRRTLPISLRGNSARTWNRLGTL